MKEYKIYTLAHPITGEIRYVGFTSFSLKNRLSGHYCCFKNSNNYKENWIKSLKKIGLKPIIELLEVVSVENWAEKEVYWIEQFRQWGFKLVNTSLGGDKTNLGLKKPKSWISPKSKAIKQYSMEGVFIKEWSSATIAAKELSINNMSLGQACIKETTSGGFQWRFSNNKSVVTKWTGKYSRHIFQYDLKGDFIREWDTVEEASRVLNIAHSNIFKVLKHTRLSAGKFIWKYCNDNTSIALKNNLNGFIKKVVIIDKVEKIIFNSQADAAKYLGITNKALWAIMNSKGIKPRGNKYTKDKIIKYV